MGNDYAQVGNNRAAALNEYLNENLGLNYVKRKKGEFLAGADDAIQKHVVNPITEAGYPNVGAGLGTALSTPLQVAADQIPSSTSDIAMSALMVPNMKSLGNTAAAAVRAISPEARQSMRMYLETKYAAEPQKVSQGMQEFERMASKPTPTSTFENATQANTANKAQQAKGVLGVDTPTAAPAMQAPAAPDVSGPSNNWLDAFDPNKKAK